MWIFKFVPDGFWYLLFLLGFISSVLLQFLPKFTYTQLSKILAGTIFVLSFYFIGALHNNQAWQSKVEELKLRIAELEVESEKVNSDVNTKTITKTQIIKERGQDVVRYIDREVVKYNNQCVVPQEFVNSINKAAEVK